MDTKSPSSQQVRWAQELSRYHFRIDYRQGKANEASDALSRFPRRDDEEEANLRDENPRILHLLQSSLTNTSLSGLSTSSSLSPCPVCGTNAIPQLRQLRQFWNSFKAELVSEGPYKASIGSMRLRLQELRESESEAEEMMAKNGYQEIDGVLHHQGIPFVQEAIRTEIISRPHDDPLAGHFGSTMEAYVREPWSTSSRTIAPGYYQ